jgi:hypothetical protein
MDDTLTATLIHAFVTSRIDHCATLRIGSSKAVTDKLQRVMNAVAHILTSTQEFDLGLTKRMRHELNWLEVAERVKFRTAALIYRCVHGQAPSYLVNLCKSMTQRNSRYSLRSSESNQLIVPFARAFSCRGTSSLELVALLYR